MAPPGHFISPQRIGMRAGFGVGGWQLDGGVLDHHQQHATRVIVIGGAMLPAPHLDTVLGFHVAG